MYMTQERGGVCVSICNGKKDQPTGLRPGREADIVCGTGWMLAVPLWGERGAHVRRDLRANARYSSPGYGLRSQSLDSCPSVHCAWSRMVRAICGHFCDQDRPMAHRKDDTVRDCSAAINENALHQNKNTLCTEVLGYQGNR